MKSNNYDAGDKSHVQRKKTKAELERERELEETNKVLSTPGGRYLIWRILEKCGVHHTTSDIDALQMAIKSGRRDVGLEILNELFEADNEVYTIMRMEAARREEDNE